ncbi:MAG: hypothetical protein EBT69_05055, partial [Verrucomicrobia bacterium]|nr:hypothetical protein [Verrucomicrobiota bacterium]
MRFRKVCRLMAFAQFLAMGTVWGVELNEAEVTTLKNIVEKDDGAGAQPAKTNDKIGEKSKITTAAASMAELTFADSSITRMGANTLFSFQSKERLIKLNQGTLLIHTPPGNGGATVDCGGVTAAVTGTTFMATRDKVGNSVFVLLEGSGGMKITVGGTTTTIRAGQAASVGAVAANDASGKSEDKATGGAPADASGGGKDKDGGAKSSEKGSGDNGGGGGTKGGGENSGPGGGTAAGDKGGGDASGGSKSPAASPSPAPASSKPPEIKVFDVDVRKIVQTTPLITEFKAPLPSVAKIEATIAVQQAKVEEGKVERLGVEVVAVSSGDGDLLVGAPMVAKEDMQIVNSKETVAEKVESKMAENAPGKEPGAGGLDISTAGAPPPPAMDKAPGGLDIATAAGGDMPAPAPQGASASSMGAGSTPPLPPPPPAAVVINTAVQEIGRNNPPPKVDLFLAGITGPSKIYDGNRNFSLVGAFLTGGILNGVSLANVPAVQFATKDVGVNIPLSVSVTLTGANAGNYTLNLPEDLNGSITARGVTVSGATASSKVYDGTGVVTIGGAGLLNTIAGDDVRLANATSGTVDKNVGNNKSVTTVMTLVGADAGNYKLTLQPTLTMDITTRPVTVTADAKTRVYGEADAGLTYQV